MKIGPNKNSHPITVDNVMLLLYMYMRPLRGAGGMYVPGQISVGSFCVLRSRTCPCCYTVFNPSLLFIIYFFLHLFIYFTSHLYCITRLKN